MKREISAPLSPELAKTLHCGERILISGTIYTARDAAHKRLVELAAAGKPLPFPMEGSVIYYVGPTPEKPGQIIGSAGPTTSGRMDAYAPTLMDMGLVGMIGKGRRSEAVVDAMRRNGAVYLCAIGGAGALLAKCVKKAEIVAYEDLGAEAVRKLEVERLPVIVAIDSRGNDLYQLGRRAYLEREGGGI